MWIRNTPQRAEPVGHSRRLVLRAGALLALVGAAGPLAGCNPLREEPDPAPDPLAPLLTGALDLAARYQAAITASPDLADRLSPIMEAHRAHAREIAQVAGTTVPSSAPTGGSIPAGEPEALLAELRSAEQQGRQAAAELCATVPADRAALAGSIAAARATHVEALR